MQTHNSELPHLSDAMPLLQSIVGARIEAILRHFRTDMGEFGRNFPKLAETDYFACTSGPLFLQFSNGVILGLIDSEIHSSLLVWQEPGPVTAAKAATKLRPIFYDLGQIVSCQDQRYSNKKLADLVGDTIASFTILHIRKPSGLRFRRQERGLLLRTVAGVEIVIGVHIRANGPGHMTIMTPDDVRRDLHQPDPVVTHGLASPTTTIQRWEIAREPVDEPTPVIANSVPIPPMPAAAPSPARRAPSIGIDKLVFDTDEWLPSYGETAISLRMSDLELSLIVEYDGEHALERKEFRFKSVSEFHQTSIPGAGNLEFTTSGTRACDLAALVEYPDSEAAAAWVRHYAEHGWRRGVRHFKIYCLGAGASVTVFAEDVELHDLP